MPPSIPEMPHACTVRDVVAVLETDPATGLSEEEAARRRDVFGPNHLRRQRRRSAGAILAHQFRGIIFWLLAGAAAFSFGIGDHAEGVAILVVLVINGAIGFVTELRAARSMEALRNIAETRTRVRRGGREFMVDARDLVPGDAVVIEAGDVVTADLRLVKAAGLQVNESVLTGEALAVEKDAAPVPADTDPGDRGSMAFKGTSITRGTGEAVVVATGMETELGRISRLVQEARPDANPLEQRLDRLGQRLVGLMLALAVFTIVAGILRGHPLTDIIQTGVALAVAAIPEGLPVVATLSLARGMWRMAARNALVNRLSSVETLGSTTVILTDKTGTLTENRMQVVRYLTDGADIEIAGRGRIETDGDAALEWAVSIGALCNGASLDGRGALSGTGDPMELALLDVAGRATSSPDTGPMAVEHAFDPDHRMMARVQQDGAGFLYAVKGAPEAVLGACSRVRGRGGDRPLDAAQRDGWLARNRSAASEGLRCLALAMKHGDGLDADPYSDLTLVALVAFADPLRADVPAAIAACRRAGIRVVMVTGDHAATAARIAADAGICTDGPRVLEGRDLAGFDPEDVDPDMAARLLATDVFARVAPETKLALVSFFQNSGHVVAMTGDGVNDAPALRKSDIGIAMGGRGTQVAREAAEMVLRDDSFPTIVTAVREGRVIFENIRKFVVYLMSCNVSEVLVVGLAVGAGLPAPLMPLQILFLNLVTDVFPAFALGLGPGDADVLDRPPRDPCESVMDRARWLQVAVLGAAITASTLAAFVLALGWLDLDPARAVTVAFVTLSLAQLWNMFNARAPGSRLLAGDTARNPFAWGAIALCLGLLGAALWLPGLSGLLQLPSPGRDGLLLAGVLGFAPLLLGPLGLRVLRRARAPRRQGAVTV